VGFGNIWVRPFVRKPHNGNTIKIPNMKEGGFYVELNFRGRRSGFNTGLKFVSTAYLIKYPVSEDTIHRQIGLERSYWSFTIPLVWEYRLHHTHAVRVFMRAGVLIGWGAYEQKKIYNYKPLSPTTQRYQTDAYTMHHLSFNLGVNAEWNLYKKDIFMSTQLLCDVGSNYLACQLGLHFMLSNIMYKDRIQTLARYPVVK